MSHHPGAVDTDERPFVLIWEVTQACDLECEHCRADAQPDRHPAELSTAEGKTLLEEAAQFGENQLVVLSGGDPLVRDDLVELVAYGTDLGLQMTLTPSGTSSLTPGVIDGLAEAGLKRIAVSLDGATSETHDSFRGEPGTFDQTVAAAEYAAEAGLPLQVNTTVTATTVDELPALADLTEELGAVLWSVFFLVPIGRGRILDPIEPDRADRVMEWLLDQARERSFGVKTTEAPQYRRVALQQARSAAGKGGIAEGVGATADDTTVEGGPTAVDTTGKGSPATVDDTTGKSSPATVDDMPVDGDAPAPDGGISGEGTASGSRTGPTRQADAIGRRAGIRAGDGFAFVSHTGEVFPSGFLPLSAGSVKDASIVDIYRESSLFERLRDEDRFRGKCGSCEFRAVCGGSRSRAYAYTGDPLESDPLCPYVPEGYDGPMPAQELETAELQPE